MSRYKREWTRRWLYRLRDGGRWWRETATTTHENIRLIYIRQSIYALEPLRATQAVEPIRKRLVDPDERIRVGAQKALSVLSAA